MEKEEVKNVPEKVERKISLSDIVRAKGTVKPLSEQNDGLVTKKDVKIKPKIDKEKELQMEYLRKIDNNISRVKKDIYNEKLKPYIDERNKIEEEKEFSGETEVTSMADLAAYKAQHKNEEEDFVTTSNDDVEEVKPVEPVVVEEKEDVKTTTPDFLDKPITDIDFDESDFDKELIDDTIDSTDEELDDEVEEENTSINTEEDDEKKEEEEHEKEKQELIMKSNIVKQFIMPEAIDLTGFTESSKTININTAIRHIAEVDPKFTESKSVVLYNTGRTISFTPLTGSEIVALSSENFTSDLEMYKKLFSTMYNHDVSPNKAKSFTSWARGIDAGDVYQLQFGLYNATFGDSNYVSYQCPKCNSFFMKKYPISSMWEFTKEVTKEQKERFNYIKEHGECEENFKSKSKTYNLSKDYIIQLKPRSIYNLLELYYLDTKFRRKYDSILRAMGYIDKVFFVDYKHHQLTPVDFKPEDSMIETIKHKCIVLYKLLTSISTDNYSLFTGMIYNYYLEEAKGLGLINYHIPEVDCKETYKDGPNKGMICNNHIDAVDTRPYDMLFTRHQLVMQSILHVD